jgi:hypothetical protein
MTRKCHPNCIPSILKRAVLSILLYNTFLWTANFRVTEVKVNFKLCVFRIKFYVIFMGKNSVRLTTSKNKLWWNGLFHNALLNVVFSSRVYIPNGNEPKTWNGAWIWSINADFLARRRNIYKHKHFIKVTGGLLRSCHEQYKDPAHISHAAEQPRHHREVYGRIRLCCSCLCSKKRMYFGWIV